MIENLEIKRWFFKHLIALDFKLSCRGLKDENCGEIGIVFVIYYVETFCYDKKE